MPQAAPQSFHARFMREEHGAMLIEYALIIAVISIALVLALQPVFLSGQVGNFITRLTSCLTGPTCA
jgi:pilus assembly protein Flp/PilA